MPSGGAGPHMRLSKFKVVVASVFNWSIQEEDNTSLVEITQYILVLGMAMRKGKEDNLRNGVRLIQLAYQMTV